MLRARRIRFNGGEARQRLLESIRGNQAMPVSARPSKKPARLPTAHLMTVQEISNYLHLHPGTVYRLANAGQLPAFKIGDSWRFDLERVDRWLEHGHKEGSGTE